MKRAACLMVVSFALLGAATLVAAEARPLAPYRPPVNGTQNLRLWGSRHLGQLARAWADAYHALHPETTFEINLLGNGTAMPALYLGRADIVFFTRDLIVTDRDGFNHVMKYDPRRIELGTGSLDTPGKSPALALLVSRDNPLARLTLAQVDAIFSSQRRRGAAAALRTWGQLGLTGEWADQPIHLYADDTQSMTAAFFQRVALGDSRRMNWEHFTEFADLRRADGTEVEAAQQTAAALRKDRYGLAISTLHYLTPDLKPLALAAGPGDPAVLPTSATVRDRRYPLARPVFACADQRPGQPLDQKIRDFLRFMLGPEGRQIILQDGSYLPLPAETARAELKKIR